MSARWRLHTHEPEKIQALSRDARVHPLVAQLLLNRGILEADQAITFLEAKLTALHDPERLPGVVEAAERIRQAVRDRRKIVIYGDYDVDGVCGTSLLWSCLKLAGATELEYYIPDRIEEGYGVNGAALRMLAQERGASLVVTVDCGISAVKEAKLARELGLELIITDHHTIGEELPPADVLVHPRLPGSQYPFGELCGCGVAFKLAWQICKGFGDGKKASPHLRDFLVHSMGLVALATVADVVPIEDENRLIVKHGLSVLSKQPPLGIRALVEVSNLDPKKPIKVGHLGFTLGPRINAAGRLEKAMMAVEMLTTDDFPLARQVASELDICNTRRQQLEHSIVSEAHAMVRSLGDVGQRGALVLGKEGWHPGVIGIVASRIADTYHRPTIILALNDEIGQGSARSVFGFDLYEAIRACSEGLISFGGHKAAAGLKIKRTDYEQFAERFDQHCRVALTPDLREKVIHVDAEVPLGVLDLGMVRTLESLEPHGVGNPAPLLTATRAKVVGETRMMGDRQQHIKFKLSQDGRVLTAIGWNMAERLKKVKAGTVCSIVFQTSINEWNGRQEVQLELRDVRIEDEVAVTATA